MRTRRRITVQVAICHSDAQRAALKKRLIKIEKQRQASYKAQSDEEEKKAVDRINIDYKYFYSFAKRFSKVKIGIGPLLDTANTLVTCPKKFSEILLQQYSSVFSRPIIVLKSITCSWTKTLSQTDCLIVILEKKI